MSSCRDVSQTQQFEQWGKDRQYEVEREELVLDVSLALHPGRSATDRSKVIPMLHVHSMHVQHVYTYFYIRTCTCMHVQHVYMYFTYICIGVGSTGAPGAGAPPSILFPVCAP